MRVAQPNFMFVLSDLVDKMLSIIAGKTRKNRAKKIERVIRWFEKDGDALVGEVRLDEVDLPRLRKLFNIPENNPMYDCYPIKTKRQIRYIQKATRHPVNPWSYDYFLECDAV